MRKILLIPCLAFPILAERPFLRPQIVLQRSGPYLPIEWIAPPAIPPPGTTPVIIAWTASGWKALRLASSRLVIDLAAGTIDAAQQQAPQTLPAPMTQVDLIPNADGSLWSLPANAPQPTEPLKVFANGVLLRPGSEFQPSGTRAIVPVLSVERPAWRFSDDNSFWTMTAIYQ